MSYPCLYIDLKKITENVKTMAALCAEHGIEITAVSKVFCGEPEIVKAYLRGGVRRVGDARVQNLMKIRALECEKWLIRTPQPSMAEEVVKYADVSLNSEISVLDALNKAAAKQGKIHKVVLMYDLGDLREGFIDEEEFARGAEFAKNASHLELYGTGTNLTCFSFVHPDTEKLSELLRVAHKYGADKVISGGNSATVDLMLKGGIPAGVNLLRLGESLLFGRERAHYKYLPNTKNDAFILEAELVEVKNKPSMPWGHFGVDSYGNAPKFEDKGIRKRGIAALGKQDTDVETMWPIDDEIEIIGTSSDHLVMDLTECERDYKVGDTVRLRLGYYASLRAFTSPYVEKIYIQ
ncbi:MAG: alanine/ornithine racemase family PLP-dependent enzyme [Clostridiales bacterium]|nr:alanine/ornithine racemase family PLP-dependent enzyme [Clostridiales bacterium]